MNLQLVEKIADTVLYEGYILYPYRPSAVKNQRRFNFGVLAPQSYCEAQRGAESWSMQTECLALGDHFTTIDVKVRFLHLRAREVGELSNPLNEWSDSPMAEYRIVPSLEVDGQIFQTWQEAVEREVKEPLLNPEDLMAHPKRFTFSLFPALQEREPLTDAIGQTVGVIFHRQEFIEGVIEISAARIEEKLYKLTVRVLNLTPYEGA
jgi:hydrogenase maturation protease